MELHTESIKIKGVSVVLGSFNRKPFLKKTIESVRKELSSASFPYEIIVVDGGSTDGALQWLSKQKDILTIIQHNKGKWKGKKLNRRSWGYFMNLGFKCAQGKYICMVSDDCLIVPGAIINGYNLFEKEIEIENNVGAVAFYWRNWPEMNHYWIGLTLGDHIFVNHGMFLKSALEEIGYIDEETYQFYHADGDLCLKMWDKGFLVIDSPQSFIEHYTHTGFFNRKANMQQQKIDEERYLKKWNNIILTVNMKKTGGWKEKKFSDPLRTAERNFRILHYLQVKNHLLELILKLRKN